MQTIPKVIHYVWVGPKPLTPLAQQCIASWQKHLPDYELKLWNETNSPMEHPYAKAMYAQGKWAFVSDYIRFAVLKEHGGIYLDTDMEVLKPLDSFLDTVGFVGKSTSGQIESSIIGSVPESDFIKKCLEFYDTDTEYSIKTTSPIVLSTAVGESTEPVVVYDFNYFFPCNEGEQCVSSKLKDAYAMHHWAESWVPYAGVRKIARRLGLMTFIKLLIRT